MRLQRSTKAKGPKGEGLWLWQTYGLKAFRREDEVVWFRESTAKILMAFRLGCMWADLILGPAFSLPSHSTSWKDVAQDPYTCWQNFGTATQKGLQWAYILEASNGHALSHMI